MYSFSYFALGSVNIEATVSKYDPSKKARVIADHVTFSLPMEPKALKAAIVKLSAVGDKSPSLSLREYSSNSIFILEKFPGLYGLEHVQAFNEYLLSSKKKCRSKYGIKIEEGNAARITEEIAAVEGRSTTRTITAEEVIEFCNSIVPHVGISKAAMEGVWIHADLNSEYFPNSYKFTPVSTHFTALYHGGAWYLQSLGRNACYGGRRCLVYYTDEAESAILDRWRKI